jgi:mono/diheme cytochrome c family protein
VARSLDPIASPGRSSYLIGADGHFYVTFKGLRTKKVIVVSKMKRCRGRQSLCVACLSFVVSVGCQSSAPTYHPTPSPPAPDSGVTPIPGTVDSAVAPSPDAAPLPADAAVTPDAAPADVSVARDAGPDGYVLEGAGPFGLTARPAVQTCKPPPGALKPYALLSQTGCVDPSDHNKPAPSLIPYVVASPLWSDGAAKERFMAIPDGQFVHVKDCAREPDRCKSIDNGGDPYDEGHLEFPVGTVLVKNFLFDGKVFETRLFVRFNDDPHNGWTGYSYEWNADHTDADLIPESGVTKPMMNAGKMQSWYYPSRVDCAQCHNEAVGFSLGPDVRNLNISYKYPSGVTANQLDTLEHIGLFDLQVQRKPAYPDPTVGITGTVSDPATNEVRARSYMQANCAICHRPGGNFQGLDLRFDIALKDRMVCNVNPIKGNATVPVAQAKLLVPGKPEVSMIYVRMNSLDDQVRMPQLATSVLDKTGLLLVSDWIKSITKCP